MAATYKMECGCLCERHREAMVKMCKECQALYDERHKAAMTYQDGKWAQDFREAS